MTDQDVFSVIVDCCREVVPDLAAHRFSPSDALVDLGVNSVERAEIVTMTLERLTLRLPRTQVFGPKNIGELARLLHAKLSAA